MTSRIQALPTDVVHLIAAGEIIDSPAAVVRELVENALDAGATRIVISLWLEQWRIRVTDNGTGMRLDDLQWAATPHSTSKIRDSGDLWQIQSLGFRGEALHSLAQLANLEICSRSAESQEGWRVNYDSQGQPTQVTVAAIAPGTIVTATHLFSDWLPRRDGLPHPAQQLRAIQTTIQHLALCHPQVTWQVEQGDRPWFALWSGTTAKQILPQVLREVQPGDLHEVTVDLLGNWGEPLAQQMVHPNSPTPLMGRQGGDDGMTYPISLDASGTDTTAQSLNLLMGLPDRCHRYRPDWIRVAVNGRMVKLPELEQTIMNSFRRTLPRDRYPVCFLHLHLAPELVDWNRHPAKAEIYLHQLTHWQEQVTLAIAQAMQVTSPMLPDGAHRDRVGRLLKTAEAQGIYGSSRSISSSLPMGDDVEDTPYSLLPPSSALLPPLKAIAQLHHTYILAEHATGIWLVEQHIAHERVLYEQLRDRWHLISLDNPVLLNHLAPTQVEQLQRIGIEIDPFGDQVWAIRTVPELLAQRDDCPAALWELSLSGNLDAALVATACRTAIRNGTPLTVPDMQTLLEQWQQTQNPRTCPHGRPICLQLEESSLSRFFRRHWVIGKSHGI